MMKFYWKLIQIKKTASNFNIETASFLLPQLYCHSTATMLPSSCLHLALMLGVCGNVVMR
ncbi:hypothetical protein OBJ94_08220, partial [Empedobacter falsenii]